MIGVVSNLMDLTVRVVGKTGISVLGADRMARGRGVVQSPALGGPEDTRAAQMRKLRSRAGRR